MLYIGLAIGAVIGTVTYQVAYWRGHKDGYLAGYVDSHEKAWAEADRVSRMLHDGVSICPQRISDWAGFQSLEEYSTFKGN